MFLEKLQKLENLGEEIKRFNDNVESLIEVLKDSNTLFGKFIGYKVTYKEK